MNQFLPKTRQPVVVLLFALLLGIFSPVLPAQGQVDALPGTRELAAALSEPSSRTDALLTLLTVSWLLQETPAPGPNQLAALEASFRSNRAWLDRLGMRYSSLPSRSTIFDPAAWFIQQELGQHAIQPAPRVSPSGPVFADLLTQMFDRSDERLAAAFLPEALFQEEFIATIVWQQLLDLAAENESLLELFLSLNMDWFDPWMAAEPPAPVDLENRADLLEQSLQSLQVLMASTLLAGPPDILRVKRLRFYLLSALPELNESQARAARHVLRLTSAIDGLRDYRYLEFIQSLLWVVSDLLEMYVQDPNAWSPLPSILAEYLPDLSAVMARNFAEVDSRFNANLAATFAVIQDLNGGEFTSDRLQGLRQELADSVTQLVLLVPEMAFYFDQPVRRQISEEIDICISVAAVREETGKLEMSRRQFDGCIESMVRLADSIARRAELAGDPDGPFGADQLMRELEMTPWQRINYAIGYLHERTPNACPAPGRPLPNPLEWSALATLLVWFSTQSPVYFQTPENEALIANMRREGLELLQTLSQQVDCISGAGGSFNDLISVSAQRYRTSLVNLISGIREAELKFRETRLQPGADVVLGGEVDQQTAYRTPGLMIGPCDTATVCEMTLELEATRALIGQFPDEYLVADQTGFGSVEICYDNMQWVDRRAERVRPEDPNVANYYGHLSFDVLGRFREGNDTTDIFGSNFVSPDEYHYLIASAAEEVLDDGCPVEWVGSRVVTTRNNEEGFSIVPNRLTYLAAARSRPSELITANWARGAEWRDWFVTGLGVRELEFIPDLAIRERLAQHLNVLYQAEQQATYRGLLYPSVRTPADVSIPLFDLMNDLTMHKALLRTQLNLFYPEFMLDSDQIRAALEGQNGLLDEGVLRRFQEGGVAIARIHDIGLDRLQQFQSAWKQQPEAVVRSGSVSASVAHAVSRLNSLYREYFAAPVPVAPSPDPAVPAEAVTADDGQISPGK